MKRGIQIVLVFSVLFGLSNCKKAETDIIYSKKYIKEIKQVRKETYTFMLSNFIPGASIAIVKDGELIYSEGYGLASKELDVRVKRATKFRIGTLSEIFTNVIYHKLVEEGTLNPDSSIQFYYPDFPEKKHKITLQNLVQQTSGIRPTNDKEINSMAFNLSLERGLEQIKKEPLIAPPGEVQIQSNFNYNLLGVVMEKATNKTFPALLKHYLTDTLRLNNTQVDNPLITIKNRSDFFDHNYLAQIMNAVPVDLRHRAPSDGMLSNAEDLAKLGSILIDSEYLTKQTTQKLWEPCVLNNNTPTQITNAWLLTKDDEDRPVYGNVGKIAGGGSVLVMYPEHNLVIACACNLSSRIKDFPVFKIGTLFLPQNAEENKPEK